MGQHVAGNEVVAVVHARSPGEADIAETALLRAMDAAWQRREEPLPLLIERITNEDTAPYGELAWDH